MGNDSSQIIGEKIVIVIKFDVIIQLPRVINRLSHILVVGYHASVGGVIYHILDRCQSVDGLDSIIHLGI